MKLEQIRDIEQTQSNDDINDFFDDTYSKVYSELLNIELKSQVDFLEKNYLKDSKKNFGFMLWYWQTYKEVK